MSYQGYKNYNHWNVSLWINNDEGLYRLALDCIDSANNRQQAASNMLDTLQEEGHYKTPDCAPYSVSSIRAAMVGM